MILPKLKSRKAIRDTKILQLYLREHKTQLEIAKVFGISEVRVGQILAKNASLLTYDVKFEKSKRVNKLHRTLENLPETISDKKDFMDVQSELRKELEGDSVMNVITQFLNVTPSIDSVKNRIAL